MYMFVSQEMGLNLHIFSIAVIIPSGIANSSVPPKTFRVGIIYSSSIPVTFKISSPLISLCLSFFCSNTMTHYCDISILSEISG